MPKIRVTAVIEYEPNPDNYHLIDTNGNVKDPEKVYTIQEMMEIDRDQAVGMSLDEIFGYNSGLQLKYEIVE